jgi:hypothetical protein
MIRAGSRSPSDCTDRKLSGRPKPVTSADDRDPLRREEKADPSFYQNFLREAHMTRHYPTLTPQHETEIFATIGAWKVLLWGFRVSPKTAIQEVVACLLIFTLMFVWILYFGIFQQEAKGPKIMDQPMIAAATTTITQ